MEKIVTARKKWICDQCGATIEIGQRYISGSGKGPRFDDDDNQIGIQYYKFRLCLDDSACFKRTRD